MTDAAVIDAASEASASCELADVLRRYGPQTVAECLRQVLGIEVRQCPRCGSPLHCQELHPLRESPETYRHLPDRKRLPP